MVILRTAVTSADSAVVAGPVSVRRIYWLNPVTPGDTVVLQDGLANQQITLRCETANQSQFIDFENEGLKMNGHKLSTIASGSVYLYG